MILKFRNLDCGYSFGLGLQARNWRRAWRFRKWWRRA